MLFLLVLEHGEAIISALPVNSGLLRLESSINGANQQFSFLLNKIKLKLYKKGRPYRGFVYR